MIASTRFSAALSALFTCILLATGCSTAPESHTDRADLHDDTTTALRRVQRADPSLRDFLDRAYGYAVFPSVGKGGVVVGGAYGRGEVFEQGRAIGYADLTQGSIGAEAGGQTYTEIVVLENADALNKFRGGNFEFAASASAIALKAGAAATARYDK